MQRSHTLQVTHRQSEHQSHTSSLEEVLLVLFLRNHRTPPLIILCTPPPASREFTRAASCRLTLIRGPLPPLVMQRLPCKGRGIGCNRLPTSIPVIRQGPRGHHRLIVPTMPFQALDRALLIMVTVLTARQISKADPRQIHLHGHQSARTVHDQMELTEMVALSNPHRLRLLKTL